MSRKRLSFSFASGQGIFFEQDNKELAKPVLCVRAETEISTLQALRRWCDAEFEVKVLSGPAFQQELQNVYADQGDDALSDVSDIDMDLDEVAAAMQCPEDLLKSEDDAPVIRILNAIFFEAIKRKASDIHIEPYEHELQVRFRLDGTLTTVLTPVSQLAPLIVSRIKVLARLDIAEKRVPQDGRISLLLGGRAIDLRVSTLPSSYGERVVLRILDKGIEKPKLSELGMDQETKNRFRQMVSRPHGIVLVTGPTGSGKSTTLYAALAEIDHKRRNVMTIEDPVEYNIDGISQTQVNVKAGMTFARGLRAILRQDPDLVLIGEIRDRETATIAVQASLTGHLVLSTLHTNTAIGAATRLGDMGVEPFLLTSTLQGVLAQRLVRRLCPQCREAYEVNADDFKKLGLSKEYIRDHVTLYRAKGCEKCLETGYIGRFGLFDLVILDHQLRQMIHESDSEAAMEKHVRQSQKNLRETGLEYVLKGELSLDEVLSVTQD